MESPNRPCSPPAYHSQCSSQGEPCQFVTEPAEWCPQSKELCPRIRLPVVNHLNNPRTCPRSSIRESLRYSTRIPTQTQHVVPHVSTPTVRAASMNMKHVQTSGVIGTGKISTTLEGSQPRHFTSMMNLSASIGDCCRSGADRWRKPAMDGICTDTSGKWNSRRAPSVDINECLAKSSGRRKSCDDFYCDCPNCQMVSEYKFAYREPCCQMTSRRRHIRRHRKLHDPECGRPPWDNSLTPIGRPHQLSLDDGEAKLKALDTLEQFGDMSDMITLGIRERCKNLSNWRRRSLGQFGRERGDINGYCRINAGRGTNRLGKGDTLELEEEESLFSEI